jgi:hypothetical protein
MHNYERPADQHTTSACGLPLFHIQVEGRGQGDPLLAALGSSLVQFGINVTSAAQENDDGQVFSVFKVTTKDGKQVPKVCGQLCVLVRGLGFGGRVRRGRGTA